MKTKEESEEAGERYDEFVGGGSATMPALVMARSANKSPLSDEGIEPDSSSSSSGKRASVSRAWSIDSAVTSEDDFAHSLRRLKPRVTRCCSSDSAVLSDDDQNKGDSVESESTEGRPRYWRTPSVVVSDYSDYSYFDEKFERSDSELEKLESNSASPSQASSCSCLDCDEVREFQDLTHSIESHMLQVCRHRRHSDSCCLCIAPMSLNISSRNINDGGNRRNSCLASSNSYYEKLSPNKEETTPRSEERENNGITLSATTTTTTTTTLTTASTFELLDVPPIRKISDCSTISSLSSDEFEVTELQPVKRTQQTKNHSYVMESESKCANVRCTKCTSPTTSTPTLNLMEQLLLAKMEKHSLSEEQPKKIQPGEEISKRRPRTSLLRTDSMDSQTSASTFSSIDSNSGTNRYCRCDDCLLGIADKYQQSQPTIGRKKTSGWRKLRNIVHWTPFFQTYKKQRYPWVQLAGHQGNFRAGPMPGTILKKLCAQEEACFRQLMHDVLRPYVPEFKGVLDVREIDERAGKTDGQVDNKDATNNEKENEEKGTIVASYLQLQDLLGEFEQPCVMDCKVGVRTYLESELAKAKERPKLRKDMYEKMVQVDPSAPSAEERRLQGVTKPRYMVWRETISSTASLGFRVEGMKLAKGGSTKDFKTTRTREQVMEVLKRFVEDYPHAVPKYLQRLKAIRATLKASPFFASHEVVGSSLLFVHDAKNAGVWMIDFAKTLPLPQHLLSIRHDSEWHVGNHEDGYLIGVNNLIDIFEEINQSSEPAPVPLST